jgi:hypothetical protein
MLRAHGAAKGAELASGIGAVVLGVGLGLLAPVHLRGHAVPMLLGGLVVHGAGMALKHRLEVRQNDLRAWESALYWWCWVIIAMLLAWLAWRYMH